MTFSVTHGRAQTHKCSCWASCRGQRQSQGFSFPHQVSSSPDLNHSEMTQGVVGEGQENSNAKVKTPDQTFGTVKSQSVSKFSMHSSYGISKTDTDALCLQDRHFLGVVLCLLESSVSDPAIACVSSVFLDSANWRRTRVPRLSSK